ncbi:hypothetical protein KRZ98_14815 [Sphingobium sp. AS12]|uniref:hypothetical protein n=1 Tax=Sphingobium sp. AS12 TaxID=2849495 RepID=UPI001C318C8C|nr:hypothetical protein [Sphingobium sp. AS12]MBV2149542.1 hypothetical protein [Sphingobium sp. AS12]
MTQIIPFPKPIKRGRKRVTSYVHTAGGDLALMLKSRDGEHTPPNVVRLKLVQDRKDKALDRWCSQFGRWDEAHLMALALYTALSDETRISVLKQLRHAAFGDHDAPDMRAAADSLLTRLPRPKPPGDAA